MSTPIEELNQRLAIAEEELRAAEIALERFEPDDHEAHTMFDDQMCDLYGTVDVCGYKMDAIHVLETCDETAYNEAFNDWLDSMDKADFNGHDELEDAVNEAQDLVSTLESEIEELEEA